MERLSNTLSLFITFHKTIYDSFYNGLSDESLSALTIYGVREKWHNQATNKHRQQNQSFEEEIQTIPVMCREKEEYISPKDPFWEKRYYRVLFTNSDCVQDICRNYFEGLEWTFFYYTKGCINTHWKYNYHYSPLLRDLSRPLVPSRDLSQQYHYLKEDYSSITSREQLEYIIPPTYWEKVGLSPSSKTTIPLQFCWAFKRYFWESSIE
jgi:5'-3' exonuclease